MTEKEEQKDKKAKKSKPENLSMKSAWGDGSGSGRKKLFQKQEEFDIYCDRAKGINYIFHGPELNCTIDHLEYDLDTNRITVVTNDRQKFDLGAKIEWLVRPYIAKEQNIFIMRTEKGEVVDGVEVPLKFKKPKITKDGDTPPEKILDLNTGKNAE
ncbi:MAG: hypothetical protein GC137_06920 [Alphaproteobacteria bacterium]|nr:hypothetical protein [Alphaproteobacteria bacterium]